MTRCPHCQEELKLPPYAENNCRQYGTACQAVTECCGIMLSVRPITRLAVEIIRNPPAHDDWGHAARTTHDFAAEDTSPIVG